MDRRKFLIGAGSLAAGSAAAVGTGAFTSVTANRSLSVEVAGDASALLAIDDIDNSPNSQYVDTSGGTVSIDFSDATGGGDGLNNNALTIIQDLLEITNQGTQNVYVWASGLPSELKFGSQASSQIQNAGTGTGENQVDVNPAGSGGAFSTTSNLSPNDINDDDPNVGEPGGAEEAAPLLAPGDFVIVEAFASGDISGLDFDDTITINALAEDEA